MTTLRIELDAEPATFEPGQRIRGKLHIQTDKEFRCDAMVVKLLWRSGGPKIPEVEKSVPADCDIGQVRNVPRGESSYPFSLLAPGGPFSYDGQSFSFAWLLQISLDVPWAFDPKVECGFSLVPPDEQSARFEPDGYRDARRTDQMAIDLGDEAVATGAKEKVPAHYWGGGLVLVLGNLALAALNPVVFAALCCTAPSAIFLVYRSIQIYKGKKAVGEDVYASASPREVSPGQNLAVSVLFTPPKVFEVEEISARLIAQEIVVRGSGSNTKTYRNTVFDRTLPLSKPGAIYLAGQPVDVSRTFVLPGNAPLTIGIPRNEVRWEVRFKVDGEGVPHWSSVQVIVVRPSPRLAR